MKTITLKVSKEVDEQIRYQAERQGVSKSSVVREALAAYLAEPNPKKKTAYDGMRHIIGSLEGTSDISTNPKYLEGLGQDSLGRE